MVTGRRTLFSMEKWVDAFPCGVDNTGVFLLSLRFILGVTVLATDKTLADLVVVFALFLLTVVVFFLKPLVDFLVPTFFLVSASSASFICRAVFLAVFSLKGVEDTDRALSRAGLARAMAMGTSPARVNFFSRIPCENFSMARPSSTKACTVFPP